MNISQHEEEKNKKVGEKTNAPCEEIARVQMSSPSLVNTDYFLPDLRFVNVLLVESAPELVAGWMLLEQLWKQGPELHLNTSLWHPQASPRRAQGGWLLGLAKLRGLGRCTLFCRLLGWFSWWSSSRQAGRGAALCGGSVLAGVCCIFNYLVDGSKPRLRNQSVFVG